MHTVSQHTSPQDIYGVTKWTQERLSGEARRPLPPPRLVIGEHQQNHTKGQHARKKGSPHS